MKNITKYIGIFLIFSMLFSCNNFEEINTNPDTTTKVSAAMLCTDVILSVAKFDGRDAKAMISGNALPKYVGYANEGQLDAQYNKIGSSGFGEMTILPNIDQMVKNSEGSVMEDSYRGVGKFARAYTFYMATMQMGDIPYSEANQGSDGLYKPKYDLQEDVLLGVLNELQEADQYFANGRTFDGDPTPYAGDPVKWRRATNALALRVLMSLSNKVGNTKIDVKARFAAIVSAGNLIDNTADYFGLVYSSEHRHPLYSTNDLFTSKTIPSSLLIDELKALNDRRMYIYAEPAEAETLAGKTADDPAAYVGVDVAMDYTTMNADHSAGKFSLINLRYLQEEASEPRILISYAEQELILAEARIKGWITTGTAEEYYKEGTKSALEAIMTLTNSDYAHGMPITQEYIDNYFTGEAAFKSNADDQLKQIWWQRYILNFFQDAQTTFFEYRRTHFPEFPINPETSLNENNKNGIPMRWLYPESESKYNRENLIEALDRQYDGYDEINKLMWILK